MTDRYSRIVLTVIAAALVTLVVQNGVKSAFAQRDAGCGNVAFGQVPCTVTWSSPLPVLTVVKAN